MRGGATFMPSSWNSSARSSRRGHPAHVALLLGGDQRDAGAAAAGPCRAADAVHVALVVLGRVVVDHVGDGVQVQASRGDVGRDQHVALALLEPLQRPLARLLRHVAVHGGRVHALVLQLLDDAVGAALRAHEHQRQLALLLVQELDQLVHLVVGADRHEPVVDHLGGLRVADHLVADRVARVHGGDPPDVAVEGGREEHRLAVLRQLAHDAVDLRQEAHVEHPVGLVQHEGLDAAELDVAALDVVLQAARRGDDDVRVVEAPRLLADAGAAVGDRELQPLRLRDRREVVPHLHGELAGGHEHEGARPLPGGPVQALDDRDRERQGLARARLGLGKHVGTRHGIAHHQCLHWEWGDDADGLEGVHHGVGDAQILERLAHLYRGYNSNEPSSAPTRCDTMRSCASARASLRRSPNWRATASPLEPAPGWR